MPCASRAVCDMELLPSSDEPGVGTDCTLRRLCLRDGRVPSRPPPRFCGDSATAAATVGGRLATWDMPDGSGCATTRLVTRFDDWKPVVAGPAMLASCAGPAGISRACASATERRLGCSTGLLMERRRRLAAFWDVFPVAMRPPCVPSASGRLEAGVWCG
ncbi:hypothetical protein Vafri_4252 [Volvox africanus]|uniref:Uncharacterized protein n=1 Tax=Volvox africanus TaxID=51714 RepID=A0A8J4ETP2_9CHLO|nr:hypothetical protein Vafri_4252 [Volvox africanus]